MCLAYLFSVHYEVLLVLKTVDLDVLVSLPELPHEVAILHAEVEHLEQTEQSYYSSYRGEMQH